MTLQSMTGFARASGQNAGASFVWELKSVNGKGLDARFRLPQGLDRLEPQIRAALKGRFARGNIQVALNLVRSATSAAPVVNQHVLDVVTDLAERLVREHGVTAASADGLLALRGVLDIPEAEESDDERAALDAALLSCLDEALEGLQGARRTEGSELGRLLSGHLDKIEMLVRSAEADPSREPAEIKQRLGEQVALLLETGAPLDEARLNQEAAFLASKADIREEIDRLHTHIGAARSLIGEGGPIGRRLDFLAQEFNRESNTLCAKANVASLTAVGLELKAVVDQFREQVQNLE